MEAQEAVGPEKPEKFCVLHELNQLECGGAERIVATICKYDSRHEHKVLTYKDGPMRKEFEALGVPVILVREGQEADIGTHLIHAHTGGGMSEAVNGMHGQFPFIETIHSPVKSPVRRDWVNRKIGVSKTVANLNPGALFIRNGLDFNRYPTGNEEGCRKEIREKLGIPQDALVIGRLGRVAPDKYVEEFMLACREFQKTHDCHVVIAGQESGKKPGYMGRILLAAECLPVKNCHVVGYQEPANILPAFDLFLYPSKDEGFGLVFAEAMYYGIPVVTYDVPVTKELFGGYAVLTGPTVKDLTDGIETALKPNLRSFYKTEARKFVIDEYSAERMAQEYSDLYDQVLAEVGAKPGTDGPDVVPEQVVGVAS